MYFPTNFRDFSELSPRVHFGSLNVSTDGHFGSPLDPKSEPLGTIFRKKGIRHPTTFTPKPFCGRLGRDQRPKTAHGHVFIDSGIILGYFRIELKTIWA